MDRVICKEWKLIGFLILDAEIPSIKVVAPFEGLPMLCSMKEGITWQDSKFVSLFSLSFKAVGIAMGPLI